MTVAQPLKGITVLDFGQVYNGPYCGFLLAQAGARVDKGRVSDWRTIAHAGAVNLCELCFFAAQRRQGVHHSQHQE